MLMKLKKFYLIAALMAAPAASFAPDYFVTPDGKGTGDGLSWENAISLDAFRAKFGDASTDIQPYYFAGGTYVVDEPLKILKKGCTLIGGFASDLTGTSHDTPTYPSATPTVFTGDINKDGVAGEGDAECILSVKTDTKIDEDSKKIVLKGFDLTGASSQASPRDTATARGALHLDNRRYVEVDNCLFDGNVAEEPAGGNAKMVGGMAFTGHRSQVVFNDCEFTDNQGVSRGGAIKLTSDNKEKGKTTFNRCLIARNSIKNELGSAIIMQHGAYLQRINSTVTDNTGADSQAAIYALGTDNNNLRYVYIVKSTVAGNGNGPQVQVTSDAHFFVANSIIVSDGDTPSLAITATEQPVSGGMNILGSDANGVLTLQDTDNAEAGNNYEKIFGDNVLGANGVIEPLADEGKYTASALTAATADWGIKADLTEDQTGAERADGSTPGAYAKSTATGITGVEAVKGGMDDAYYTLQGVKLGSRPTATGIYIHNGKKVIIR